MRNFIGVKRLTAFRNVKIKIGGPFITDLKLKTGRSIGPIIQRSSLYASIPDLKSECSV